MTQRVKKKPFGSAKPVTLAHSVERAAEAREVASSNLAGHIMTHYPSGLRGLSAK